MFKHTQTIRRQFADEYFECVWPFCGVGIWRVKLLLVKFLNLKSIKIKLKFNFVLWRLSALEMNMCNVQDDLEANIEELEK